jgi:hypothetical protein
MRLKGPLGPQISQNGPRGVNKGPLLRHIVLSFLLRTVLSYVELFFLLSVRSRLVVQKGPLFDPSEPILTNLSPLGPLCPI